MYKCPKCEGKLDLVMSGDVKIDKCISCGGLWFDKGELYNLLTNGVSLMIDGLESAESKTLNKEEGYCPLCHDVKLERVTSQNNPDITIDKCPSCEGIWLDKGELTTLTIQSNKTDLLDIIKG